MDSLPYGVDTDQTQALEPETWYHSVPMQQLLEREGAFTSSEAPASGEADMLTKVGESCLVITNCYISNRDSTKY